jgi:sulfopyruvate decarboxylase alpha subunit
MSDLEKSWQDKLYDTLRKENISIFSYVPDAGHKVLIDRAIKDNSVTAISLTSEQEGIGIAVGSYLGGSKAVLLMQSSGVGNCINQLSLIKHGQFPFLTIVTMRGEYGEGNPWQFAMGEAVVPTLNSMGVKCLKITTEDEIESTIKAALIMVFQAERSVAVLLSQKLLGAKVF